jgi:hypothetical protein
VALTRVLLVADSLQVGGAERHVVGLAVALVKDGHAAEIATSTDGSLSRVAGQAGVPVRPLLGRLVKRRLSMRYAGALQSTLRRGRFDVVHAHMFASTVAAALATARDYWHRQPVPGC